MKDRGIVPNAKLKLHLCVLWHKTLKWGLCPSKMVPNILLKTNSIARLCDFGKEFT